MFVHHSYQFKVDRLQIIVVAKNIILLQLFISRMPKMYAIPQLVSAPLILAPDCARARNMGFQKGSILDREPFVTALCVVVGSF